MKKKFLESPLRHLAYNYKKLDIFIKNNSINFMKVSRFFLDAPITVHGLNFPE